jgi:O-antigen ligase
MVNVAPRKSVYTGMNSLITSVRHLWIDFATQWHDTPRIQLHHITLLVLAAGFILSPEPVWADLFYVLMLPLAFRTLWHEQAKLRLTLPHKKTGTAIWGALIACYWRSLSLPLRLAIAIIVWFTASLTWDAKIPSSPGLLALWSLNVICTLAFVLSLADGLYHGQNFRERLVCVLISAGMLNLIIAFARLPFLLSTFWADGQLRMAGWAASRHQIVGAIIIGLVVLLAFDRLCRHPFPARKQGVLPADRGLCMIVCCIGCAFMVMTGSRGPVGSIMVATPLLAFWLRPRLAMQLTVVVVLLAAIAMLLAFPSLQHCWQVAMQRGDSSRLAIWRTSWEAIKQHPWLGYGPTYHLPRIHSEAFPHNLFLSAWVYNGAVGLGLLIAFMLSVLHAALAATTIERPLAVVLLLFITLCAMTDMSQIVRGPSMMWYQFWLPLLFSASAPVRTETRSLPPERAAG